MHTVDYIIIVAYLVAVAFIGWRVARRTRTGDDLFLAGRSLGARSIGLSLFASNISSTTLIGLAGAAYVTGISVANYEWMAAPILVLMAFVFIPLYLRGRVTTVPEYLERRFSRTLRRYFSGLTIIMSILVDTAGGLYAGALVLKTFFPELELWSTCAALAVFAGVYTAAGGLKAVVYTDVIQAIVLLAGSVVLTGIVLDKLDWSWANITAVVPEGHLSLIRPMDDPALPWLGTLIGVPILGFWYWTTNQYITQRVLGARNEDAARKGALLGGALKLLPLFVMVLPGALAIALFPDLTNGDQVFPHLVTELLPVGVTGLIMAGLIAAIMSSVDSTLNSASTLVVHDFVRGTVSDIDDDAPPTPEEQQRMARWGRWTTLILMAVAAIWAPLIADFEGLFAYLQQAFSIVVPPVVAVFLVGALWGGATARAGLVTFIVGHAAGVALFALAQLGHWTIHYTITAGMMTAVSAVVLVSVSLLLPDKVPAAVRRDTVWDRTMARPVPAPRSLLGDYRFQAALVLVATTVMLIAFW